MKEFKYGDISFVETSKYLSYVRTYEEEETLVIYNLEEKEKEFECTVNKAQK